MRDMKKILADIDSVMSIQLSEPSNKTDRYMRCLSNGMIMINSIIRGIEPKFLEPIK